MAFRWSLTVCGEMYSAAAMSATSRPSLAPEAVETIVLAQLRAVLTSARAVLPAMVATGRGSVVVLSSQLARSPEPGVSALSMAKGAIEAAAWASADVRRGWADHAPLRRNALACDVAGAVAFLPSEAARFVTGGNLAADGGVVMS